MGCGDSSKINSLIMKIVLQNPHPVTYGVTHVYVSLYRNRGPERADFNLQFYSRKHGTANIVDGNIVWSWRDIPEVPLESVVVEDMDYSLYAGLRAAATSDEIKQQLSFALNQYQDRFFGTLEGLDFTILEVIVI